VKIETLSIHRYRLPFRRPLRLATTTLSDRRGLLVHLVGAGGIEAWGEVAPLPGFSPEVLADAEAQLKAVAGRLTESDLPMACLDLADRLDWWPRSGSVEFGIASAVLGLVAGERRVPVRSLIGPAPRDSVAVNALLDGDEKECLRATERLRAEGFSTFKLKVGRRPLLTDVNRVRAVRKAIGSDCTVRLDANRAWSREEALAFAREVVDLDIEYVEEPFQHGSLNAPELDTFPVPIALDESLMHCDPEALMPQPALRALVLKPTLLGLERAMQFAWRARAIGMMAVITSAFESSVGCAMLAECAACLNGGAEGDDVAVGLGTLDVFAEDLLEQPVTVTEGRIQLPAAQETGPRIRTDVLKEVFRV
jgi:O-succinylbenzoate synthase